jgi:ABC-2 type transport system ATP-binding protein
MKSILARSLFKSYDGINAVDDIDLDVDEGQIFGFLGPNGAGKSTVIKLLTTLIHPTSGEISVLNIDPAKEPLKIRKKIGVVLQQPSYEPTRIFLSVREGEFRLRVSSCMIWICYS